MALTVHDGGAGADLLTGSEVLHEVLDLIAARLPRMAVDDPVRISLSRAAPVLGRSLGRSPARLLRPEAE